MKNRPSEIRLRKHARVIEVSFVGGERYKLPFEYLRVHSPSAEVQGHGPGQEVLQVGKQDVLVEAIEPVGNYAVRLVFDDGHDTGLYSWDVLHDLGANYEQKWHDYLERLTAAGHARSKDLA